MIARHAYPGEARAATLLRLAERGDQSTYEEPGVLVFHDLNPAYTSVDVNDILAADDVVTPTGNFRA
jgi:hypothetical protein